MILFNRCYEPLYIIRLAVPSCSSFLTMSFTAQVFNIALGVLALWLIKKVTEKKPLGRPIPGPKGWPIIGNLLDVPTEVEYKVFSQWRKKYGEQID